MKRRHNPIKFETIFWHSFIVSSLFFLFFIAWALFFCGIRESVIKINCHYLQWQVTLSSLCKPISQCIPNICLLSGPVCFLQRNALPFFHTLTHASRPSTTSFTRLLLIAQTFLLETILVFHSVFNLTWLSLKCFFFLIYYCIMGIPHSAEQNVLYIGHIE